MNREIKFRGLNKKGEWVYGSLINNCHGIKHMPKQNTKTWIVTSAFGNGGWFNIIGRQYVLPETVGQLTSIPDSEANELYVGDICSVEGVGVCLVCMCPYYGVVFKNDGVDYPAIDSIAENDGFYLIGNIHQNKDLLDV